jgi:hypothetical protein
MLYQKSIESIVNPYETEKLSQGLGSSGYTQFETTGIRSSPGWTILKGAEELKRRCPMLEAKIHDAQAKSDKEVLIS